ncbi:MAG: hypothetical protein J7K04_07415 [Spirochaetales bacterium]|nr:hypothetical protein [Spirochaetales bacterium]
MDSVLFHSDVFFTSGVDKLDDTESEPDKSIDYIFLKEGKGNYRWQVSGCCKIFPRPVKFKYRENLKFFWVSDHVGIVLKAKLTVK